MNSKKVGLNRKKTFWENGNKNRDEIYSFDYSDEKPLMQLNNYNNLFT